MKALLFTQHGTLEPVVKKMVVHKGTGDSVTFFLAEETGIQASVGSITLGAEQVEELIRFFND